MIGPVVAKMAVEQARKAGSAIGDVYFLGAVGSIAGTFLAGFVLMYLRPDDDDRHAGRRRPRPARRVPDRRRRRPGPRAWSRRPCWAWGRSARWSGSCRSPGSGVGGIVDQPVALAGHVVALALAVVGLVRLIQARLPDEDAGRRPARRRDAARSRGCATWRRSRSSPAWRSWRSRWRRAGWSRGTWVEHLRLDERHRRPARRPEPGQLPRRQDRRPDQEREAGELAVPGRLGPDPLGPDPGDAARVVSTRSAASSEPGDPRVTRSSPAITMTGLPWGVRVFFVVTAGLLPAVAHDGDGQPGRGQARRRPGPRSKRTGSAIGQVYAWGMVGSILGTFLTGFLLIDVLGTKGVLLLLATSWPWRRRCSARPGTPSGRASRSASA